MTKKLTPYKSLAEMPQTYTPVAELEKTLERDAAYFEKHYGPDVPRLTPRGRPRAGVKVEKTTSHTIRMAESVWAAARARAKELGITANAAVQLAVREWTAK